MTISMVRLDNLVIAKLSANDLKDLGELKAQLERTLQERLLEMTERSFGATSS